MIAFLRGGEPGNQGIFKGHQKVCYQNKNCASRIASTLIIFTYVLKKIGRFCKGCWHKRKMIAFLCGREPGNQGILKGQKKVCQQKKLCIAHCQNLDNIHICSQKIGRFCMGGRHKRKMIAFLRRGELGNQRILNGHKEVCQQNKNCAQRIARTLIIFTQVLKKQEDFVRVADIKEKWQLFSAEESRQIRVFSKGIRKSVIKTKTVLRAQLAP